MEALNNVIPEKVDSEILPLLAEFIRIPSCSPKYDPEWETNGLLEKAQELVIDYLLSLQLPGFTYEILKEPGRAPLFFAEIPGTSPEKPTVLMYGHFDKQPPMDGWKEGTGPYSPVILDGRLYGRGGTDDGYAVMSAGMIIKTLQELGIPHGRILLIGENEEESGSESLVHYLEILKNRMGRIDVVFCLDAGTYDYDHFTLTSSLRGFAMFNLKVSVLNNARHSGAGGLIPSPYRILNSLIARIQDPDSGEILLPELLTDIPPHEYLAAVKTAALIGSFEDMHGLLPGVKCMANDVVSLLINNTWKPCLTVTGFEGLPKIINAGNVIHSHVKAKLSIRVPPGVDIKVGLQAIIKRLTENPPYNAKIEISDVAADSGWSSKKLDQRLEREINESAKEIIGTEFIAVGLGGSVPIVKILGDMFPQTQIIATGIVHTDNNVHGPNENMNIDFLKKYLTIIAKVIARY